MGAGLATEWCALRSSKFPGTSEISPSQKNSGGRNLFSSAELASAARNKFARFCCGASAQKRGDPADLGDGISRRSVHPFTQQISPKLREPRKESFCANLTFVLWQ